MALATNLGFPRMGAGRDLKKLVEAFWAQRISEADLLAGCRTIRERHWRIQKAAGLDHVPCNDFSLFDQVLDHCALFNAVPPRFRHLAPGLEAYFAMGRGLQRPAGAGKAAVDVESLEMKKWMDTNYHYFVPEIGPDTALELRGSKPLDEYLEARSSGVEARPVLLGPLSFLLLAKPSKDAPPGFSPLALLPALLRCYEELLGKMEAAGVGWVQLDEPVLCMDHAPEADLAGSLKLAYSALTRFNLKVLVATYFERAADNLAPLFQLPVAAIHVDLVRAPGQLAEVLKAVGPTQVLSLGLVDGRNVWRADLESCIATAQAAVAALGAERVMIAPSCSLLHCPHSLEGEAKLDPMVRSWMAWAVEKLAEVKIIARALNEGPNAIKAEREASRAALESRRTSPLIKTLSVHSAAGAIGPHMLRRQSPFPQRQKLQHASLQLPLFPTTTIGSFPQTAEVRSWRSRMKKGELSQQQYDELIGQETRKCVRKQEELGLDVLVHGEFERTDMVEFFGENFEGYAFTQNGWVQSYGSRCVKPPIIYGDVRRSWPITVQWTVFAQSLTEKPMKGMLTGPITCLQWSFVRNDQPRKDTAFQLALAIREEVADLETAGIKCIQIDEPAIREGLPLRRSQWESYLAWAVDAFLLSSTGVKDSTQIHTHMCYSDFNDIFPAIQRMDADVITIENSKSDLKLLSAFERHGYTNEIGPGLYDIHSPRVPSAEEMAQRLCAMLQYLPKELLWVNPDCGLKTRGWTETEAALKHMCHVAAQFRKEY